MLSIKRQFVKLVVEFQHGKILTKFWFKTSEQFLPSAISMRLWICRWEQAVQAKKWWIKFALLWTKNKCFIHVFFVEWLQRRYPGKALEDLAKYIFVLFTVIQIWINCSVLWFQLPCSAYSRLFTNNNSCKPFADFISQTIMELITVCAL